MSLREVLLTARVDPGWAGSAAAFALLFLGLQVLPRAQAIWGTQKKWQLRT